MASLINKARKPKFELHLTIYDLNNVPLVQGKSYVKWHLPHSMHGDSRGRTDRRDIDRASHRAVYNYSRRIPLRISIDRQNRLTDSPIEFEVLQELPYDQVGSRTVAPDEKSLLGRVRLNLSEYVEESENIPRRQRARSRSHSRPQTSQNTKSSAERPRDDVTTPSKTSTGGHHKRLSSRISMGGGRVSPTSNAGDPKSEPPEEDDVVDDEADEGIVRRYLMQDSKVNSTLKVGILMVQVDGERGYVAPALKSAPMFGGIAGFVTGADEPAATAAPEPTFSLTDADAVGGTAAVPGAADGGLSSLNKSRDASEVQDMYRRSLAASWMCQPGELPADQCIEDIFAGGDGWENHHAPMIGMFGADGGGGSGGTAVRRSHLGKSPHRPRHHHFRNLFHHDDEGGSGSTSSNVNYSDDPANSPGDTLRPSDVRRFQQQQQQQQLQPSLQPAGAHRRQRSGDSHHSDRSGTTLTYGGNGDARSTSQQPPSSRSHPSRRPSPSVAPRPSTPHHEDSGSTGSTGSVGSAAGPDNGTGNRGRAATGFRRQQEVEEYAVRDDLVAWKLPGTAAG